MRWVDSSRLSGTTLLILLLLPGAGFLATCDAQRVPGRAVMNGSSACLSDTTISLCVGTSSLCIGTSSVREAIMALRHSPEFLALHQRSSGTTAPLLIVYEGKQHKYYRSPGSPQSVGDNADKVRTEISPADNILFIRDTDLPQDDLWPLNRELSNRASRPLTCAQAEELLRTSFGWDQGSGAAQFGSGWCGSPGQVVWEGTKQKATVRDLLLALLRHRTSRMVASAEHHVPSGFQILPLDLDPAGYYRWNILVIF